MITVERFTKDGQNVWNKDNGRASACLKTVKQGFNPKTMSVVKSTYMCWINANDEESLDEMLPTIQSAIENEVYVPYRTYSLAPFYSNHAMDTKGVDGESLNRYSQTHLGTAEEAQKLDRTYVEPVEAVPLAIEG
jgi:hypothetical protein